MANNRLELGIVGLGKMGHSLALQCVDKGIYIAGHSAHVHPDLAAKGVHTTPDYAGFAKMLKPPRAIYLSVPAGPTVDEVLDGLTPCLDKGDLVVDGGNSFYLDSIRREKELREGGIYYLDCGTSGGAPARTVRRP